MNARMCALVCALSVSASPASAAPIATLFSTGQAEPGQADPHYRITGATSPLSGFTAPAPGPATVFSTPDGSYPIQNGVWALNKDTPAAGYPTDSRWIGPSASAGQNWLHSFWTYQTTFDLTGLDPDSAVVTGAIAADNAVEILLNGKTTGFDFEFPGDRGYTTEAFQKQTFELNSGFLGGLNTLTFVVRNGNTTNDVNAPTGLRVAISGTADPLATASGTPVPEPASALTLGGLLGAAAFIRRTARRTIGAAV